MAKTAEFYTISKRNNSTLVPAAGSGVSYNIDIKEAESLLRPVFRLQLATRPEYSMVLYEGRYYFIRDIISVRERLWELSCECDVLATYKAQIQSATTFVLYASGSNTEIVDERLSIKTTPTHAVTNGGAIPGIIQQGGTYVLTVVGRGCTSSYACSYQQMIDLLNAVANWSNVEMPLPAAQVDVPAMLAEGFGTMVKCLRQVIATGHAGDNIKSCTYVPAGAAYNGKTTMQKVYLGDYDTGMYLPAITDRHYGVGLQIAIPWQATDWRRNAPYHEIYLVIPSLGVISLSPSDLIGVDNIVVTLSLDLITGEAKISVKATDATRQIGIYGVNFGAQFPIGASNVTPMDITTSILGGAAAGIAALTAPAGGAAAAAIGIKWTAGVLNNLQATPTCIGGNGGAASLGADPTLYIYTIFHDTIVEPSSVSAVMGVPQMKTMRLSGISGYLQTLNASVSGSMTSEERQLINSMLDGGIYIE